MVCNNSLLSNHKTRLQYRIIHLGRPAQVVSKWNALPLTKRGWRLVGEVFNYSWAYQFFIFGLSFAIWAGFFFPVLYIYQKNNTHRTFEAAIGKERAHKKKLRELEAAAETS
jgi:hypothetical protein